jgi:uncharacterized protein (TIGR02001 family)
LLSAKKPAGPAGSVGVKGWIKLGAVALLAMVSSSALAGFSGTATLTSDYDYRGISQTDSNPALQGSVLFNTDSGFYASAWGSSLDWGPDSDASVEIDYFGGITREFGDSGLSWDLGVLAYTYPGLSSANFIEYYGGLVYGGFNIKASYSDDFAGVGESGWYINGGYTWKHESGFSAFVYGGYSFGNAFDAETGPAVGFPEYWNYGVGVGYTTDHLYFELKGVGTDQKDPYKISSGVFANDFRALITVTVSF